jgi:hypothetical protein
MKSPIFITHTSAQRSVRTPDTISLSTNAHAMHRHEITNLHHSSFVKGAPVQDQKRMVTP